MESNGYTYVVTYDRGTAAGGAVNKLLREVKKSEVLEKAKKAFCLVGEYGVEYYMESYGMFIRVDALNELPDGGKLRLVAANEILDTTSISSVSTQPVPDELSHSFIFVDDLGAGVPAE